MASVARGARGRWARPPLTRQLLVVSVAVVAVVVGAAGARLALTINETERRDERLAQTLAAASVAIEDEAAGALASARRLASSRFLQERIADRDVAAIETVLARQRHPTAVFVRRSPLAGAIPRPALRRSVVLRTASGAVASIVVAVPLDRSLLVRATRRGRLDDDAVLAVADAGAVVATSRDLPAGRLPARASEPRTTTVGGARFRVLGAPVARGSSLVLVALTPARSDGAAVRRRRIVLAAAASAVTLVLLLALLASTLRNRSPGEQVDRRRRLGRRTPLPRRRNARDALALVGDTLAATHDPDSLLPVILDAAIGATGALGGRIVRGGVDVARAGTTDAATTPFVATLENGAAGTKLELIPPQAGFDRDARELGTWLAAQAAIALENARLHRLVKTQATTDELTGLANRRRFMEALALELKRAERFESPLGLVLADLDDFKLVNDRYGHHVGDSVLRELARVFQETLRDVDVPARIGGEEFAVLLPATDEPGARDVSERLRAALADATLENPEGRALRVTASFGVAVSPPSRSAEELLAAADAALYRAKREGKNRVATSLEDR